MSNIEERRALRALRTSTTRDVARSSLAARLGKSVKLNPKSRCSSPEKILFGSFGADLWATVETQLRLGKGGELRYDTRAGAAKFCSAWSSAALAINSVAPFLTVNAGKLRTSAIPALEVQALSSSRPIGRPGFPDTTGRIWTSSSMEHLVYSWSPSLLSTSRLLTAR
jgi:hypothetical protein